MAPSSKKLTLEQAQLAIYQAQAKIENAKSDRMVRYYKKQLEKAKDDERKIRKAGYDKQRYQNTKNPGLVRPQPTSLQLAVALDKSSDLAAVQPAAMKENAGGEDGFRTPTQRRAVPLADSSSTNYRSRFLDSVKKARTPAEREEFVELAKDHRAVLTEKKKALKAQMETNSVRDRIHQDRDKIFQDRDKIHQERLQTNKTQQNLEKEYTGIVDEEIALSEATFDAKAMIANDDENAPLPMKLF